MKMSEFLNLQAALGQTSVLSGLSGANVKNTGGGGFGAVLGAVMADSMGVSEAADISVGVNANASRADGLSGGSAEAYEAAVSEGASDAELEADKAAKALAELYGALESPDGRDGELPAEMFTAEGAKAFISVLERYISQGNVPEKDLEGIWKDVSAEEKDAYADILGAIALGSAVLPDENGEMFEVSSEDLLGFALKEAGKLAMRPAASRKSDKDGEEAASYIMSVFIASGYSVNTEKETDGAMTIAEGGLAAEVDPTGALEGASPFGAHEAARAMQSAAENFSEAWTDGGNYAGNYADNVAGNYADYFADSYVDSYAGDFANGAVDGNVGGNAVNAENAVTVTLSELGEALSERIFDADPDFVGELGKFCGELAGELKAQAAKDMENAFAATPEDIGRQAFMARVSAPVNETAVAGVEAALRQNASGSRNADIDGETNGEPEAFEAHGSNDGNAENAVGRAASEEEKDVRINAYPGAVQNAAVQATQSSRVFEAEETATAEDTPVSPMDTEEIARRISEHISRGKNESITLRLDPEDLGEIKITVSIKAGETIVAFEAHKSESAQLIGDRAAALAESLAAKGIAVREISVTDMSSGSGKNGSGEFYGGGNRHAAPDGSANNGNADSSNAGQKGYSRHYYFEEPEEAPTADENYYYNKEANLWLSV